jgi:hypothetical protein
MSKHVGTKHKVPKALHNVRKFFPKVTRVTDAAKGLEIEVTKQDDKVSRRNDHAGCAMAVACKREYKLDGVIIARTVAYLVKGDEAIRYYVPERATREIVSFDRGGGFAPGSYALTKPTYNLGHSHGKAPEGSRGGKTGGLAKRFHHLTDGVRTVLGSKEA